MNLNLISLTLHYLQEDVKSTLSDAILEIHKMTSIRFMFKFVQID